MQFHNNVDAHRQSHDALRRIAHDAYGDQLKEEKNMAKVALEQAQNDFEAGSITKRTLRNAVAAAARTEENYNNHIENAAGRVRGHKRKSHKRKSHKRKSHKRKSHKRKSHKRKSHKRKSTSRRRRR